MDYDYSKHNDLTHEQRIRLAHVRDSIQMLKNAKAPIFEQMKRDSRRLADASVIVGINSILDILDNEEHMIIDEMVLIHEKARLEDTENN